MDADVKSVHSIGPCLARDISRLQWAVHAAGHWRACIGGWHAHLHEFRHVDWEVTRKMGHKFVGLDYLWVWVGVDISC